MQRETRNPDWSFIIQVTGPNGRHLEYMRIDQELYGRDKGKAIRVVGNQVAERLDLLHRRTRCHYHVIYEGNPEMATTILKQEQECPF